VVRSTGEGYPTIFGGGRCAADEEERAGAEKGVNAAGRGWAAAGTVSLACGAFGDMHPMFRSEDDRTCKNGCACGGHCLSAESMGVVLELYDLERLTGERGLSEATARRLLAGSQVTGCDGRPVIDEMTLEMVLAHWAEEGDGEAL
jgi:hypothetical protein